MASPPATPLKALGVTLWFVGFTGVLMHLLTGRPVSVPFSKERAARGWALSVSLLGTQMRAFA